MIYTKYEYFLIEQLINESMLTEKINLDKIKEIVKRLRNNKGATKEILKRFNSAKDLKVKKYLGIILLSLVLGNFVHKNNKWSSSREYEKQLQTASLDLINKSKDGTISLNDVNDVINKDMVDAISYVDAMPEKPKLPIISMGVPGLIEDVNSVKPGRLSKEKVEQYDRYDKEILDALDELKAKGENPIPNLIKTIMVIETGMKPRKNSLGYEGFPQTKKNIVDYINKKHGTHFTMKDMYDAGKSAQFIYYYLKSVIQSDDVETIPDILIAYNWGVGNLGKYKRGEKDLPSQSSDYVTMYSAMEPYFDKVQGVPGT